MCCNANATMACLCMSHNQSGHALLCFTLVSQVQVRRSITKVIVTYWRIMNYMRPEEISQKQVT